MPRLQYYRESISSNLWDSFGPQHMADTGEVSLFGDANLGNLTRTSMVNANQLASDQSYTITRWCARSNIPARLSGDAVGAWDAFTHATTLTLVVGTSAYLQGSLAELLAPSIIGGLQGPSERGDDVEYVARKMYETHARMVASKHLERYQTAMPHLTPEPAVPWWDVDQNDRALWISAASVCPFARPVIIPVRQNFGVRVQTPRSALDAFRRVMPEDIAPAPLIWVHLIGLANRDMY